MRAQCRRQQAASSLSTALTSEELMKFGFDHVHLVGSDLDASEQFYRDKFGAETIRRDANGAVNLMMRLDGVNLFIRSPRPSEQVSGDGKELRYTYDHFGVVVQDLNA